MILVVGNLDIDLWGSLIILHIHKGQSLFKNKIDPNGYYYEWY
jgi:hypothetical protein